MRAWQAAGKRVAFVPTMGALHAGHLALVTKGLTLADVVVASIFVNPKQFGPNEDLARYPRDEAGDAVKLAGSGCSLLYAPDVATMYPPGFASFVRVGGLPDLLCGRVRPGHFDGVATVVAKLLSAAQADAAVFGEKDWQQLAIVKRMAADLDIGTEIHGCATVRDDDGLALSSRNAHLSADERSRALVLPQALQATRQAILNGMPVAAALAAGERTVKSAGFARLDYLELVDSETLHSLGTSAPGARLMVAGVIGTMWLIDNIALH